ncbi:MULTISPECIES: serine protease [unclassified Streptomyces]|uniref:trypsin-like serine peptidase n=1 Tax=unclassified Streptomyces TaxID=2593676 RepID=UPI00224FB15F|nr:MULTISPECIES: trypsin-like serine protease [unclassified Streptomyces]MCX4524481.1 S1 family peptidase [Streptomyces sp. NBC_01551]MCX4544996.1 S1 family peptidase [Streptomyces sp. NBC_01565]
MIQHLLPRACDIARTPRRRASTILPALAAVAALLSVPDASAAPALGVTAQAAPSAAAARVGPLFEGSLDGGHFCTASVVRSDYGDVIATAAHCLDGLDDPENTVFAPGYHDGVAPYGLWRITGSHIAPGWTEGEDPNDDIAFATVAPLGGAEGQNVQDLVGGFPMAVTRSADPTVTVLGYPSSRETPLRCANVTSLLSDSQRRIDCPALSGGTSGSPWLVGGAVAGVLGGYEGGGTDPDVSYSAVLGEEALDLYREVAVSQD